MADPLPIIPPKENLQTVIGSNTIGGYVEGEETVPIDSLSGGISTSKRAQDTVKDIAAQMSSPSGYIERLIVDQDGNVIEGAHRLEALRKIGIEEIPVTRIVDPTSSLDLVSMKKAIKGVGKIHPDHINQIMSQIGDMLRETGNNPNKVLTDYTFPKGYEKYFKAALTSLELDEPRSTDLIPLATDLVALAPEEDPSQKKPKQTGKAWRGIGSLMRKRMFPILQVVQKVWGTLSDDQKGQVTAFLNTPTHELFGMDKPGIDYFRQMLGMGPEQPEEGILSPPMDEASRMARAGEQKFDIDSYHGTRDDFTIFEKGDLGYHFGTPEQAWKRLVDTRETADWEPHNAEENIMPVRLRLKNPLELPDVGSWQLPEVIARRALETKWGKSHSNELNEIMDEAAELAPTFADLDDWADSPEASELMDELRDMIKKDGYDGIKYRNIVESKYGKEGGGLTVEGHKQYEALNKEWHELRRAIFIRNEQAKRPLPHPSEATPEKVQEWLNRGLDTTPEERARLEQIANLKELVRKNESYDPHLYIVFDAENIRSRFAEFDPSQSESPEISKAAGGFIDKPLMEFM